MAKHTQTIRRQIADELFECVWPFCEIGAKRVKISLPISENPKIIRDFENEARDVPVASEV